MDGWNRELEGMPPADDIKVNICLPFIISKSNKAHVSTKQGTQGAEYKQTFREIGFCSYNAETQLCSTLQWFTRCYGAYNQAATARNIGANPFSFL